MSKGPIKYRPSNGSEGVWFVDTYCTNCINGKYEHTGNTDDEPCEILTKSFFFDIDNPEYPKEWIYLDDQPHCTSYVKWDWNQDDDGNWNDPPVPEPIDPNQLMLFSWLDEIVDDHIPEDSSINNLKPSI